MHTPNPDEPRPEPQHDEDDVVPIREPPSPGKDGPPLIAIQRHGS